MRIISGKFNGKIINAPEGQKTHPMSEKIRGALFSVLGDINNLSLLDAFSGSGAIGLEAFSRGANEVILVEKDKNAQSVIEKNLKLLNNPNSIKLIHANVNSWSSNNSDKKFDIVILDPPYDKINIALLNKISLHTKKDGITIFSLPPDVDMTINDDFKIIKVKIYGDSKLVFYRRMS